MDSGSLTVLAKNLRKNSTDAERLLWKYLRDKQFEGMRFRRQHPLGKFIVDFVCLDRKLIIEIDGGQHVEHREKDAVRDAWIRSEGFTVMRFWNHEVLQNIEGVLITIQNHPPHTPPLKGGDEK